MDGIIVSGSFICFLPYIGQNVILTLKSYLLHNFGTFLQCPPRAAAHTSATCVSAETWIDCNSSLAKTATVLCSNRWWGFLYKGIYAHYPFDILFWSPSQFYYKVRFLIITTRKKPDVFKNKTFSCFKGYIDIWSLRLLICSRAVLFLI